MVEVTVKSRFTIAEHFWLELQQTPSQQVCPGLQQTVLVGASARLALHAVSTSFKQQMP